MEVKPMTAERYKGARKMYETVKGGPISDGAWNSFVNIAKAADGWFRLYDEVAAASALRMEAERQRDEALKDAAHWTDMADQADTACRLAVARADAAEKALAGGVTEEMLRAHDGYIKVGRGCEIAIEGTTKALAGDSPTWPYVLAFARLMEAKLAANRHKGDRDGWLAMSPLDLLARAQGELGELTAALADWHGAELDREPYSDEDRARFRRAAVPEAADVANFAMMIADTCGALSAESIAATVRP